MLSFMNSKLIKMTGKDKQNHIFQKSNFVLNWGSLHARLNSHYQAWSYGKKKYKKIRAQCLERTYS